MTDEAVLPPPSDEQVEALREWCRATHAYRTEFLRKGETPAIRYRFLYKAEDRMQATGAWQYLAVLAESLGVVPDRELGGKRWHFASREVVWEPVAMSEKTAEADPVAKIVERAARRALLRKYITGSPEPATRLIDALASAIEQRVHEQYVPVIEALAEAREILWLDYSPCEQGCECIIHTVDAALAGLKEATTTQEDTKVDNELLHEAWGLIANASDWSRKHDHRGDEQRRQKWVEAAKRWRDKFHETLTPPEKAAHDKKQLVAPRLFVLERTEDVTGISGTGIVAEGVEFSDGRVVLRWCVGEHRSTVNWDSIESVEAIHGHDGRTVVRWL